MPKVVSPEELDRIDGLIAQHPEGIGVDALSQALGPGISRRTLQRRLASLVEQQRIRAEGEGRALRYHRVPRVTEITVQDQVTLTDQVSAEVYVPISPEGEEIRAYVRQPIQQRKPVGYDRALLEAYRPNETRHLSREIREHLHQIGRSPDGERPAGTYARDILGRLLIDLSWASSRLEGNTYTRLDTQNLIERGQAAEGKDRREAQMILNHKAAIELLVEQAEDIGFNTFTFFNLHALLSENLLADPTERHSAADRPLFPHDSEQGRGHRGCLRAGILYHGAHPLLATLRGREQAGIPAGRQHPAYPPQSLSTFLRRRPRTGLCGRYPRYL